MGSVLDANRDGRRDNDTSYTWWVSNKVGGVAIPTHFYVVVVRCTDSGVEPANCGSDKLDAVGMLFQHPTELGVYNIASVYSYFVLGIIKFLLLLLLSPQDASQVTEVFSDSNQIH